MSHFDIAALRQEWARPSNPRPIVIFGAGSIVNDGHLPAYRKAGFPVAGIYDVDRGRAQSVAERWGVAKAYVSLAEAVAEPEAVFDLATPPAAHPQILETVPEGSAVLIQKPMGSDLEAASKILRLCRERKLVAAVNFQLRFSAMMLAVRDAIEKGYLGRVLDIDVQMNYFTPWHLFPFLKGLPRIEITMHSIHYLDLIRSLVGNPVSVAARTLGHPSSELPQTRTSAILDFADDVRCTVSVNHNHNFGSKYQMAQFKFEGDKGAAVAKIGVMLDYPNGQPDELWLGQRGSKEWTQVPLCGTWYPDAFAGRMSNIQRVASGEDEKLEASVEDAWHTMALVEACYQSTLAPFTPVAKAP